MEWGRQQQEALGLIRAWLARGSSQVFYLAGWAGTGKTTMAREIAGEIRNVRYAAYTGKAAAVLAQKGCTDATTIHRLIYDLDGDATDRAPNGEPVFRLAVNSPMASAGLAIIDEVSMVDSRLGQDLLRFGVKVLVLGDPAQLPPVGDGAGYFTAKAPDYQLTEIHRQAEGNPIIRLSMTVREGGRLAVGAYGQSRVISSRDVTQADARRADQILCGRNATRRQKNNKARAMLGRSGLFSPQDKIVCLKNDYEQGLLNGSIWAVEEVEFQDQRETIMAIRGLDPGSEKRRLVVTATNAVLRGTEKELSREDQRQYRFFDFAYALTVHKAQGSQWDDVLLFDESAVFREDRTRWLYTGITRAAQRITIAI